ncbi:hypothetical protein K6Q96_05835 [Grimontia kaedaensis]|uniref:Uncharacterized protein n=2 Tax=Grimontia kaedaensis TaxID=2872157 RepID=A0ABY4WWR4_9GAMM|nr:hypothetical protein K6Q96_05835 [Grimontia kaedaensis]
MESSMALKQKKTSTLRKSGSSSRYWNLANFRRQLRKKQSRGCNRRNCEFYNLQLSSQIVEQNVFADAAKETNQ